MRELLQVGDIWVGKVQIEEVRMRDVRERVILEAFKLGEEVIA